MKRVVIVVLLLLNGLTLAWQWDAFARWGLGPNTAHEPERMAQQIRPEALKVLTPAEAARQTASESARTSSETP